MRSATSLLVLLAAAAGVAAMTASAPSPADAGPPAPHLTEIPEGYREWRLISVAREEGKLDDIRAVLGNDAAIEAMREGRLPLPEGAVIARLAWSCDSSPENDAVFGARQSFVAGLPKNGVQFMVKDSTRYAATGGWGYGHFDDGKPAGADVIASCHRCHQAIPDRDFVFTRWAP